MRSEDDDAQRQVVPTGDGGEDRLGSAKIGGFRALGIFSSIEGSVDILSDEAEFVLSRALAALSTAVELLGYTPPFAQQEDKTQSRSDFAKVRRRSFEQRLSFDGGTDKDAPDDDEGSTEGDLSGSLQPSAIASTNRYSSTEDRDDEARGTSEGGVPRKSEDQKGKKLEKLTLSEAIAISTMYPPKPISRQSSKTKKELDSGARSDS